jgi:uncharacterized protein YnzC (UPF0291/DUF896 family)
VKLTDRTESRNCYEEKRRCLLSIEMLNARRSKKITQERLAEKQRLKKSYISKLKTEKVIFQLSTLIDLWIRGAK